MMQSQFLTLLHLRDMTPHEAMTRANTLTADLVLHIKCTITGEQAIIEKVRWKKAGIALDLVTENTKILTALTSGISPCPLCREPMPFLLETRYPRGFFSIEQGFEMLALCARCCQTYDKTFRLLLKPLPPVRDYSKYAHLAIRPKP
jgi:hypothetical protein